MPAIGNVSAPEIRKLSRHARGMPAGSLRRRITLDGSHEEGGVRFDRHDEAVGQLYAALAVLARDFALSDVGATSKAFKALIETVSREEHRLYGEGGFPRYGGRIAPAAAELPQGLARSAASNGFSFDPLLDPAIVHEWTFKPGKRLFERWFATNHGVLKEAICSPQGFAARYKRESDLIAAVGGLILTLFGSDPTWGAIAALLAVLTVRSMDRLCA